MNFEEEEWNKIIEPGSNGFAINLKQLMDYKDLIFLFAKRDLSTTYKQTILGPLWYLIQPICFTIMYIIVFYKVAGIDTDGVPATLFYFSGTMLWSFFYEILINESEVFMINKYIFEKVYFPRLVVPISIVIVKLVKFSVQFVLFIVLFLLFAIREHPEYISIRLLGLPLVILWIAILSESLGLVISSVTTKYRDLAKALVPLLTLYMYATPVVYPLSAIPEKYQIILKLNPLSTVMECFRAICFKSCSIELGFVFYALICTLGIFLLGIFLFHKNEKSFVDVI